MFIGLFQLEDLKRDNDALKRELARKKFDQESLENQVIGKKSFYSKRTSNF